MNEKSAHKSHEKNDILWFMIDLNSLKIAWKISSYKISILYLLKVIGLQLNRLSRLSFTGYAQDAVFGSKYAINIEKLVHLMARN